jgi:hypothetical protein
MDGNRIASRNFLFLSISATPTTTTRKKGPKTKVINKESRPKRG